MRPTRVLALAGGVLGADLLDVLDADPAADVVGVLASHAPGGQRAPCPFATGWAERHGVPWRYVASWRGRDAEAALDGLRGELMYSLAYDLILPPAALRAGGERAVNLHRGIAPDFRGAYSTTWALELGAREVGVTLHVMVPDVDAGSVLAQRRIPVPPEWTAAEAIAAVEALTVSLCRATLGDLLAGRLAGRQQPAGGRVFGRQLPPHDLDEERFPGLAGRVRALWNPPYPAPRIDVGARWFEVRERPPEAPAGPPAALAPAAAPRVDNRPALTFGRPSAWLASPPAAVELLRERVGRPLALPATAPPAWAEAAGADARAYAVRDDLQPDPAALTATARGAAVLLRWPFGRPPDPAAVAAVAAAGGVVVEDRTQALLATWPPDADWVLLAPGETFALGTAGVLLGPVGGELDGAEVPMNEDARFALCFLADLPAARLAAERAAAAWAAAAGARCIWSHWPLGTVAHRYPILVDDAERMAATLRERGIPAAAAAHGPHAGRLLALPCQGVTEAAVNAVRELAIT